jgi:ABC-type tungstate transport system permease subunit
VLLNPAHALVGVGVENAEMAGEFVEWLARADGGQEVIEKFEVGGTRLYSRAPGH